MGKSYSIQLKPEARPRSNLRMYHTMFHYHYVEKYIHKELSRMQSLGVISHLDQPTYVLLGMWVWLVMVPIENVKLICLA